VVGTGSNATGATWTGIACIAGGAAGGSDLQPETSKAAAQAIGVRTRRTVIIVDTVFLLQGSFKYLCHRSSYIFCGRNNHSERKFLRVKALSIKHFKISTLDEDETREGSKSAKSKFDRNWPNQFSPMAGQDR
jgi:hypothetical protein